jgi:hypothetical protein
LPENADLRKFAKLGKIPETGKITQQIPIVLRIATNEFLPSADQKQ